MLHITYENEIGRLHLGGGSDYSNWHIIEIDGLGLAEKSLNAVTYPWGIGQQTLSETLQPRTITIQCDIHNLGGSKYEVSNALKILNYPGDLLIYDGYRTRKISARCTSSTQGERNGGYKVFAMQFVCDYPHFEDSNITSIPIFKLENLIGGSVRWYKNDNGELVHEANESGTFKLPCVFTRLTSEANVLNIGDVDSEPIIKVYMQGETSNSVNSGILYIKNKSTNQQIELNCEAVSGDIITLNIPNRTIYNQHGENLISYLSPRSFLSDFWLKRGNNYISVINNITDSCIVTCEFSNKYIEAVIE